MTIGPRKIAAFVSLIAASTTMIVSYQVGGGTGILVFVSVLQIAIVMAILYTYVNLRRNLDLRTREITRIVSKLDQRSVDIERDLANAKDELKRESRVRRREFNGRLEKERRLTDQGLIKFEQNITRNAQTISRDQYHQLEALLALYQDIKPGHAFPPFRDWAVSPDLLHFLYRRIIEDRPARILEMGSGVSTVVMAYALQRVGSGQIISLDHSEPFRDVTAASLEQRGLTGWVDLRLAPLKSVEVDGETYLWYSTNALPTDTIDMVFVDGPPGKTQTKARFPALPLTHSLLSKKAVVILDDGARDDEREIANRWVERHPDFTLRRVPHEKGTVVLEAGI